MGLGLISSVEVTNCTPQISTFLLTHRHSPHSLTLESAVQIQSLERPSLLLFAYPDPSFPDVGGEIVKVIGIFNAQVISLMCQPVGDRRPEPQRESLRLSCYTLRNRSMRHVLPGNVRLNYWTSYCLAVLLQNLRSSRLVTRLRRLMEALPIKYCALPQW